MVTAFAFCVGTAFAKSERCTITEVVVEGEKSTVTMECKKDAQLQKDDKVKVKVQKKKEVEGC